jgi:hypothetical protein
MEKTVAIGGNGVTWFAWLVAVAGQLNVVLQVIATLVAIGAGYYTAVYYYKKAKTL